MATPLGQRGLPYFARRIRTHAGQVKAPADEDRFQEFRTAAPQRTRLRDHLNDTTTFPLARATWSCAGYQADELADAPACLQRDGMTHNAERLLSDRNKRCLGKRTPSGTPLSSGAPTYETVSSVVWGTVSAGAPARGQWLQRGLGHRRHAGDANEPDDITALNVMVRGED